ncbi:MAG: glycosyltransferase family 4 protein [Patescibacteria group bacterium]
MEIAQVTPVYPPYRGGMGNVAADYATAMSQRGDEVTVFTPEYSKGFCGEEHPRVERLNGVIKVGNAALVPSLLYKLRKTDLIHLHYPFYGGACFTALAARLWRKPLIITYHMKTKGGGLHGLLFLLHRFLVEPFILKTARVILVSSMDYAQSVGLKHRQIIEMPFGVDADRFYPGSAPYVRDFFGIAPESKMLLFVGGLDDAHYFKGVDIMIEAAAKLPQDLDWHLIIAGDGSRLSEFQRKVVKMKLGDRIHFPGKVSEEGLPGLYRECDVHILASIDHSESFGIVTLEAAASGLPSIVTNLPGVRTLVEQKETGLVIPPNNAKALAVAIEWLLQHPEKIEAFGHAAHLRVITNYEKEHLMDRLKHVYRGFA